MTLVTNAGRAAAKRRAVKRSGGGNGSANLKTARLDPTRTGTMRRALIAEMRRRFARLKAAIVKLVVDKDAFGADRAKALTTNAGRWYGQPDREKVRLFAEWLRKQMGQIVAGKSARDILKRYALEGMKKGAGRAFDDVRAKERALTGESKERLDFYNGTREQFLRESFRQPVSVQRVEALAGRSFDDLENITTDTSARMGRTLMDGLVQGKGAEELARDLADEVDIGRTRAEVIARTEIIRAHAEGQLQAMDEMGVAEVGVAVEWVTAKDEKVCPKCEALEGVVLKISEARGMLPRHPNCRCAWLPAGLGEDGADQIDTKRGIMTALEEAGEGEDWGPDVAISRDRPEGIFNAEELTLAAFCPTGDGGGQDNSCSPLADVAYEEQSTGNSDDDLLFNWCNQYGGDTCKGNKGTAPARSKAKEVKARVKKTDVKKVKDKVKSKIKSKPRDTSETPKDADKITKNVVKKLSAQELEDVRDYTDYTYQSVNSKMRECPPKFECVGGEDKRRMDNIEKAISLAKPLDQPTHVYRGLFMYDDDDEAKFLDALSSSKGKTFSFPSITSTSFDKSVAGSFANKGILFKIVAKHGLPVDTITKAEGDESDREHEFVMSGSAKFRVVRVSGRNVHLEQI